MLGEDTRDFFIDRARVWRFSLEWSIFFALSLIIPDTIFAEPANDKLTVPNHPRFVPVSSLSVFITYNLT